MSQMLNVTYALLIRWMGPKEIDKLNWTLNAPLRRRQDEQSERRLSIVRAGGEIA